MTDPTKAPRRARAAKATKAESRKRLAKAVEAVVTEMPPALATPSRAALADRAPAVYTAQLVHLDTPDTEARVLAHLAHQRKSEPGRTKSMVLRDIVAAGLAVLEGGLEGLDGVTNWHRQYGPLPRNAVAQAAKARDARKATGAVAKSA